MRQRKLTFALVALMLILAGCKGESPTAPPVTPGPTPGGGVTPPTSANITLTASNPNPLVNSNVIITATVTENGQNVPNGTAVQFGTSLGTFTDTGAASSLRTTTNGVSTVTLTSPTAGTATVSATVGTTTRTISVTFSIQPVTPQPPSTAPTVTAISPTSGPPAGGTQVTIIGTNLRGPVRVLFDIGDGSPKEGFSTLISSTQINVVTPAINLTTGQTKAADVIIITEAGTPTENRIVKAQAFTYQLAVLTPVIRTLQPTSGPVGGGTRVTIIGDAFQQPVQVFFGSAEAQVISVLFNQIIVMSPRANDTAPDGSALVTGPVAVKVVNVGSGTSATSPQTFRYTPKMVITTMGPTEGPFTGGTRVRIDGSGFDQPLAAVIGGVAAQVISVSGTEVIAITSGVTLNGCGDVSAPTTLTNTDNGDSAVGPTFIYRVPRPLITAISNPNTLGGTATITVFNALGFARIQIGGVSAPVTGSVVNSDGTTTFTVQIPSTIQLTSLGCTAGGSALQPTAFDVTYTSATTGCTDTSPRGIIINPPAAPIFTLNPQTYQPFTATITPATVGPPPTPATVTPSGTQTVNVINTGTTPMTVTAMTSSGAACGRFTPLPVGVLPLTLNQCESFPIVEQYAGQTTAGTETCVVTITTSAGSKSLLLVGTSQ